MRSHSKAATAGSTQRQAGRLGRFVRGAFAGRAASSDAKGSGAPAARQIASPASVFVAFVAVMALSATPASALQTHLFKEAFGSAEQPTFNAARGIAVDQSTGDVLVMDAGETPSIKRYNADGTPDNFSALGTNAIDGQDTGDETPQNGLGFASASESQIAVDNSGGATDGNIYVTQGFPNLINVFSEDGEYLGQLTAAGATPFSEACGVAVDPFGAVYVGDYASGIHKFVPAANPPVDADNTATFTTVTNPCTLAAGVGPTAGFLFAAQYNGPISKLDSGSGELKYTISATHTTNVTITVDPSSGHVYGATGPNTIDEFDASGAGSATQVSSFNLGSTPHGLAVNGGGELHVSRAQINNIEVFGPTVTVPDVVTGSASTIDETTATLNGTVNPDGVALEECEFEYGTSTSYGQSAPCAESTGTIGTGTNPVAVHADISGLSIGTTYHFRLVAKNANDTVEGADGDFETLSTPAIKEQWAHDVVYTEATLKAKINPKGFASTYYIEYGTTDSYGQSTAEFGIGSDSADHIAIRVLETLTPGSTYHYRFVANNSVGPSQGPDHTFTTYAPFAPDTNCANQTLRTGSAMNLADCRAYEMVSPLDKNGGDIKTGTQYGGYRTDYSQASQDGDKITYSSATAFGNQPSGHYSNQYIASRGPNGWSTDGINAPQETTIFDPIFSPFVELNTYFLAFSDDLSNAWLMDFDRAPLTPDGLSNYMNLYRRDNIDGSFEALTVNQPLEPTNSILGRPAVETAEVQGASADGSHGVYAARARFTPDASDQGNRQIYDFSGGEVKLASVLPNGEASTVDSNVGAEEHVTFYPYSKASMRRHAVSDDGSRIFWKASGGLNEGPLYVRIDGQTTVQVSSGDARFWSATPDGAKALFTEGTLTRGEGAILKESKVDSDTTTQIAGEVYGVVGASEDLSYVYFVSNEDLAAGATAGEPNLYLSHGGVKAFIGTLTKTDAAQGNNDATVAQSSAALHAARVTPDGRHMAFQTTRSLTGYDNTDAVNGKADLEVFIYEANAGKLLCASCKPSGARPAGHFLRAAFAVKDIERDTGENWAAAWLVTELSSLHAGNPLSDDGNRLFFNAFDALVPDDNNGVQDVYEWRAQGTGHCEKPDGCISLISTGESKEEAEFVDADPTGRDVFFTTASSIRPEDRGLIDIYDARSGGGYPYVAPSEPCVGDACQQIPPAPNDPTPASAGFRGKGNMVLTPNCPGQAKRAAKLSRRAKKLRRRAKRAPTPRQTRVLRKRSVRYAKRAKGYSKRATRCRRANRGARR